MNKTSRNSAAIVVLAGLTRTGIAATALATAVLLSGCSSEDAPETPDIVESGIVVTPLWDSATAASFAECAVASPLLFEGAAGEELIVAVGDVVAGLSTADGSVLWSVELPVPEGRRAFVAATPVIVDGELVVVYQALPTDVITNSLDPDTAGLAPADGRDSHWAVVVDLAARALSTNYEPLRMAGQYAGLDGDVGFADATQFSRSDLKWMPADSGDGGRVIVTYGNVRDIQPWHGWAFALDLDAWRADVGTAIADVFVTTPETDCGVAGSSGSQQRICGGGLWAPSGPLVVSHDGTHSLILAPGNGQVDLERSDFANSLLRLPMSLAFEHGCDPEACADFNNDEPAAACLETCEALFIPRPLVGEGPPQPESGVCDGLSFFECWQQLDYIGGSTPAYLEVGEYKLLAYPTKDGHVYLVDLLNMGTLYDRHQLVEYCGTQSDECRWFWAGMIVTEPAQYMADGEHRIIVPTFMPDRTHPAGVVSLAVVITEEGPRLQRRWEFPDFETAAAVDSFRVHPSRASIAEVGDFDVAVVVEPRIDASAATLYVIDAATGVGLASARLAGSGYRFTRPLVDGDRVYVNSCVTDRGRGSFEAFSLTVEETVTTP